MTRKAAQASRSWDTFGQERQMDAQPGQPDHLPRGDDPASELESEYQWLQKE